MAYQEKPGMAGDALSDETPGADGSAAPGTSEGADETIHIPADVLPPGIKEGDCLRCTGMDENGCMFTKESADEGTPWESDFRREMSPREPQQEAS